jgi:hypothetical protein
MPDPKAYRGGSPRFVAGGIDWDSSDDRKQATLPLLDLGADVPSDLILRVRAFKDDPKDIGTKSIPYGNHLRDMAALEAEYKRKLESVEGQLANAKRSLGLAVLELSGMATTVANLRAELSRRQASSGSIPKDWWRKVMALCHPDRHGNSAESTAVAQWLLSVRPEGK